MTKERRAELVKETYLKLIDVRAMAPHHRSTEADVLDWMARQVEREVWERVKMNKQHAEEAG